MFFTNKMVLLGVFPIVHPQSRYRLKSVKTVYEATPQMDTFIGCKPILLARLATGGNNKLSSNLSLAIIGL